MPHFAPFGRPRWAAVLLAFSWTVLASAPGEARRGRSKPIVAVFNIEDRGLGLSSTVRLSLSDFLAAQLATSRAVAVVPRDRLRKRLVGQKRASYRRCYAESCQIEIGKELAAQMSLSTVIMKLGAKCIVTSVLYDLRSAASAGGGSTQGGCSKEALVTSLRAVVGQIAADQIGVNRAVAVTKKKGASRPALHSVGEGGLVVKSTPAGAEVWLDGAPLPGETPLVLRGLRAGEHDIRLRKGQLTYDGKITVAADKFRRVALALKKDHGRLEVLSKPIGARILIDGREVGTTPLIVPRLELGQHRVECQKKGYKSKRQRLTISRRRSATTLRCALQRAVTTGAPLVFSHPVGARVFIDGRRQSKTPARLQVAPGAHEVRLELAGHRSLVRKVVAKVGEQTRVWVRLPAGR